MLKFIQVYHVQVATNAKGGQGLNESIDRSF
jgi:hypothetical protein